MTGVRSQKEPWNLFQAFFVYKGDFLWNTINLLNIPPPVSYTHLELKQLEEDIMDDENF